jgi:predicted GNAT family N-acyltransferase
VFETSIFRAGTYQEEFLELFKFRYDIYVKELDYIEVNPIYDLLMMEFDEYEQNSTHIIIKDDSKIVACARVIHDKGKGLLVLNKLNQKDYFPNEAKVEVSRMMIHRNYRFTKLYRHLIQAIAKVLFDFDNGTYVLADTFIGSNSYNSLLSLGFCESSLKYHDTGFKIDKESVVLYSTVQEIKKNLKSINNPALKYTLYI